MTQRDKQKRIARQRVAKIDLANIRESTDSHVILFAKRRASVSSDMCAK
jgi:hypothetical protein